MAVSRRPFRIFHLSDLHVGELEKLPAFYGIWQSATDFVSAFSTLRERYGPIDGTTTRVADLLLVSGDLVCDGKVALQHQRAALFVKELASSVGVTLDRVFIVPGNHEVNRSAEPAKRFALHESFFRQNLWPAGLPNLCTWIPQWNDDLTSDGGVQDTPLVHRIPFDGGREGLILITLTSAHPRANVLHEKEWRDALKDDPDDKVYWQLFDRGLVSKQQLDAVEHQLNALSGDEPDSWLRITMIHHNPVSWARHYVWNPNQLHAESNMLSNGPELLDWLRRRDVALVLHGHRHIPAAVILEDLVSQNHPTGNGHRLVVVSAPSAGLNPMAVVGNPNQFVHKDLGLNVVEVRHARHGWHARVGTWNLDIQDKRFVPPSQDQRIWLRRSHEPAEFLTSQEGVERLSEGLIEAREGVTMLHYATDATWAVRGATLPASTPVTSLISDVLLSAECRQQLSASRNSALAEGLDDLERVSKASPRDDDNLVRALATLLKDPEVRRTVQREICGDGEPGPIRRALGTLKESYERDGGFRAVNYALELLRLGADDTFALTKCVHICAEGTTPEEKRRKFLWLIESVRAMRPFPGARIGWLPFCIERGFAQSIVCIGGESPPAWGPPTRARQVLVGWAVRDLQDDADFVVLRWDGGLTEKEPLYELSRDVLCWWDRTVHAIAARVMRDFPLLSNGTVHVGWLRRIASDLGMDTNAMTLADGREVESWLGSVAPREESIEDATGALDRFLHWTCREDACDAEHTEAMQGRLRGRLWSHGWANCLDIKECSA